MTVAELSEKLKDVPKDELVLTELWASCGMVGRRTAGQIRWYPKRHSKAQTVASASRPASSASPEAP